MKKRLSIVAAILWILSSSCFAESLKHVDAKNFLKLARLIEHPTSVYSATFVGTTGTRVYLEHLSVITWAHIFHLKEAPTYTLYWTDLDQLPPNISNRIKTAQFPWIPFSHTAGTNATAQLKENAPSPKQ